MQRSPEKSPWLCHLCDVTSSLSESRACAVCYRVTCPVHLHKVSVYNAQNGLYEPAEVCLACCMRELRSDPQGRPAKSSFNRGR